MTAYFDFNTLSRFAFCLIFITITLPAGAQEADSEPKKSPGFRLSSKPAAPEEPAMIREIEPSSTSAPGPIPEGVFSVGHAKGQSKLPPELAELAQEGAAAFANQQWERARDIYLDMVSEAPDNALAYANLGVAEHQLGNLLAASGNLKQSLEINPTIAQNWQTLGLIQYQRGELNLALSSLTRAIHESPQNARTRIYLAAVVRDYGWKEAAITELQRAIELDPKIPESHYNLAVTYLEEKPPRLELARRHYFSAIDLGAEPSEELEKIFSANP